MKKKTPDFKRKHLDTFLYYYKLMVTYNENDVPETLDCMSKRILGGAGMDSSAFRTYKQRLICDGLIREDYEVKRWMATGKGLNYTYRWENIKEWTTIVFQWGTTVAVAIGTVGVLILEWQKYHADCLRP